MPVKRVSKSARQGDLRQRLQDMLYEYHAMGRFEEARPYILCLMEIAQKEKRRPRPDHATEGAGLSA